MKFIFLGTGTSQGIPVIGCKCEVCLSKAAEDKRLRCSLLVESVKTTVVIDIGPDFRQQMLRQGVGKLDAIVLTHEHMDHLAGLDEVRAFNYSQQQPMPVYATLQVQKRLKEQYSYIFNNSDYPGIPSIDLITIDEQPFQIDEIHFIPIKLIHGDLPVLGFRMGDFTYITDANSIAEEEKEKVKGSRFLTLNALRKEPHHSHFNLEEAMALGQELGAEETFLTHLSHQMGKHKELVKELPDGIRPAYDNLEIRS